MKGHDDNKHERGRSNAIRAQLYQHAVSIADLALEYHGNTEAVVLEVIGQIKHSLDYRLRDQRSDTINRGLRLPTSDS